MEEKIKQILSRFAEIEAILGHPEVFNDQKKYRALTQEHGNLSELKNTYEEQQRFSKQLADNRELLKSEKDPEFVALLKEEIVQLEERLERLQKKLEDLLVPPDPNDNRNIILELRAGTGGDEAALFVGDCVRMYKLYADRSGWRYELISCTPFGKWEASKSISWAFQAPMYTA